MPKRSITTKELRAECTVLERAVLTQRLTTKDALTPHRPGGAENPDRSASGWLSYYRHLQRTHAKGERATPLNAPSRAAADAAVMDALRSKPVRVEVIGTDPSAPRVLHVYAKSLDALLQVHALDRQLAYMTQTHAKLLAINTAQSRDTIPRVLAEISYTYQLLAWIVTTEGPGMPYAVDAALPTPPAEIAALEPWDIVRIVEAHHKHMLRLHAIASLLDDKVQGEGKGTRPSWSMFAADAAAMFGEDPDVVMRDRALPSLLAASWLHNASRTPPAADDADAPTFGRGRERMGAA
jgi:hypothetical protein